MASATKSMTMNQVCKDVLNVHSGPSNYSVMAEILGKSKGSKLTRVSPAEIDVLKQNIAKFSTNGNGPTGDKPEEPKPPFDYSAFAEWTQGIKWLTMDTSQTPHAGQVIKVINQRVEGSDQRIPMQRYYTADGGERVMRTKQRELRSGYAVKNGYGTSYYLLSRAREKEGFALLREFPGCPTLETACSTCRTQLFASNGAIDEHLRSILERILVGNIKLTTGKLVRWRQTHSDCWTFNDKLAELKQSRQQLIDRLGRANDAAAMASELTEFDRAATAQMKKVVKQFGNVRSDRAEYYLGEITKAFNHTDAQEG